MLPYFTDTFGNPSSLHGFGRGALKGVDAARDYIAAYFNCRPSEIYFTSGATESNNWVLRGIVGASNNKIKHIVTTNIEHPAILDTCRDLEREGVLVSYIKCNNEGVVSVEDVKNAVTDNTILVSVMAANNETGAIQPIKEIGAFCKAEGIPFHSDAVQAIEALDFDVNELNLDMLSLSGHKFHAPKGIGLLYLRSGVKLKKLITGGHQERNQRAGTTNAAFIVALAKGLEIAKEEREATNARLTVLRDYFIKRALAEIPYCYLNGGITHRLPNNVNLSFGFIEGESILMLLDIKGIAVSSGSACSSGSLEPSHVILALGVKEELAHSSVRFSLGKDTTKEELDYTLEALKESVARLREISPLFNVQTGTGSYV
jgi:cysteine desulfurase